MVRKSQGGSTARVTFVLAAIFVALVAGGAPAEAQTSPFPFISFELHKLSQVRLYKSRDSGKPETSLTYAIFNTSRAGRLEGEEIALASINDDLPAALEKRQGDYAYPKLRYEPSKPFDAKFTCRTKDEVWNVEYRTSLTVAGDVYTLDGSVRGVKRNDATWIKTATDQVAIVVSGRSCTLRSVKRETVDEFYGHTRVSRVITAGADTVCKLNPKL